MTTVAQTLEELQTALTEAVSKNPPDTVAAQSILSELMRRDTHVVRFSTDAGIINRLGQELVGKQETAVAELIKNSFDADATHVKLTFSETIQAGGSLKIEDNGLGMTREQLLDGFMRLSSADKILNPVSSRYKRRRAGRKGIGRFAVQRLGAELLLTTQTLNANQALQVRIDWNAFQVGVDLGTVASIVEQVPKERAEGTTLRILHLRESWSEAEQNRVYRYASEVLQPFPLEHFKKKPVAEREQTTQRVADPGFQVTLVSKNGEEETLIADQEQTVFAHALAVIEAYVDSRGEGIWSIASRWLKIKEEVSPIGSDKENTKPFYFLRRVALKAYYFIWPPGADYIPKLLRTPLAELGRQQGGIRVFRNGFRVLPYGDRDNDWAELDASSATRDILPPHANSNFFAFIELDDPRGELFEETASREGLIENEAFKELRDFAYRALTAGVVRIAEARGKKQTKGQKNWKREEAKEKTSAEIIQDAEAAAQDEINKAEATLTSNANSGSGSMPDNSGEGPSPLAGVKAAVAELGALARGVVEAQRAEALQELGMLRVLASLGLVIGEFTHEIRQALGAAQINAEDLNAAIPLDATGRAALSHLAANLNRIRGYSAYFYQTVADNADRQLQFHDLRAVGRQFVDAIRPAIERVNLTLDFQPEGYELLTPPMHVSELSSILFNFYSNSLKAIDRAPNSAGRLLLRVGREDGRVFLEFADDGAGVPEEIQDRIFNAFFTTATPSSRDSTLAAEAQGSGLGLKIVADIVAVYDGSVYLTAPPAGYRTCLRVEFPEYDPDERDS